MTAWLAVVPSLLLATALVTLPGLPTAYALRLRGLGLVAGGIAASLAIIAVASLVAPFAGVRWGLLPVLVCAAALAVVALVVRRWLPTPATGRPFSRGRLLVALPVLLAGGIISVEIVRAIQAPENVSQTYDAVFHLNAAAFIMQTGDASPLHMNMAVPHQTIAVYPTLWHSIVAIVAGLTGTSVPLATNAVTVVVAAWVWPVAVLFFSAPFLAGRRSGLLFAGIFAATSSAFPYLLLSWGVLYPNVLANALVPIALGFTHLALRPPLQTDPAPRAALWIGAFGALGATAFAQPNGVYSYAVLVLPLIVAYATRIGRRGLPLRARMYRWSGVLATFAVIAAMWIVVQNTDSEKRYAGGVVTGIVGALSNAPLIPAKAWFVSLFVLAGAALLLLWKRHRWIVLSYGLTVLLYAIAIGLTGPLRDAFTVAWYNDAARLAALLPVAAVPLAAVSAMLLFDALRLGLARLPSPLPSRVRGSWYPLIALLAVAAILVTGARGANIGSQIGWMSGLFSTSPPDKDEPDMLSSDELALLERLDGEVPEGARIAGDPWNGSAYAYAFSGRALLFPHMAAQYDTDAAAIAADLRNMGPSACTYLDRLGIDYVLDFGDPNFATYAAENSQQFAGLRHVSQNPILHEVDREGEAALYRVECG
ncbi:hypothetical protein Leucomu_01680 [Leucobacter muris]|uniref:Uncharacterized protein n=1 Tax=Leucobacter muris TaxID=1935379 RepID=A0ABX5QCR3_9MICO|nr:DUF6541 family protein [Leucobacter muris]QAB16813.1 hypothetical protein Leucomu_01680 [Leucobacter muris]